jgi:hypothetical protein
VWGHLRNYTQVLMYGDECRAHTSPYDDVLEARHGLTSLQPLWF